MEAVTLNSRWHEILGNTAADMPEDIRRQRWEEWKAIAEKEAAEYWSNPDGPCSSCAHRDKDWCKLQGLPCSVNPILTFREGIIGMACMGLGYEPKQLKLEQL